MNRILLCPRDRRHFLRASAAAVAAAALGACSRTSSTVGAPPSVGNAAAFAATPQMLNRVVLLCATTLGDSVVVAGERGVILRSADWGKTWTPCRTEGTSTLTAISVVSPTVAMAVGHEGTVLKTTDGGNTWVRLLTGRRLAELALEEAKRAQSNAQLSIERKQLLLLQAERLVADGPDKPLLDVAFTSELQATAIGAYGLLMKTVDGGVRWTAALSSLNNPQGLHLNAIASSGSFQVLVGEQGLCARSDDAGASYTRVELPTEASMFSAVIGPGGDVWTGGLNGRLLRSKSRGASFESMPIPFPKSITTMKALTDGRLVLGHVNGSLTVFEPDTLRSKTVSWSEVPMLNDVVHLPMHGLLGVGARGPRTLALSALKL